MADKMVFPIGFDLKGAVDEASKEWENKYAKRLEDLIAKRPINVKLKLDLSEIGDLSAKITRGVDPKITPKLDSSSFEGALKNLQNAIRSVDYDNLTEKEASALKTLTSAVNSLARAYGEKNKAAALEDNVTKELKAATAAEKRAKAELTTAKAIEQRGKKEANIAIANANRTKAEENATAATKRRQRAEADLLAAQNRRAITENNLAASAARMEKAQLSLANAQNRTANATRNANREFKAQDGYISRLIKRLAVYAGYRQITGFFDNVRKVTAEFELQRVSLGAIIQDQTRANALFSEIKSFALKSPVSILDLTKYTKQLAAYKIGVDELFETTKKLTDVSVGLGVSMDRVVLAYGQVRAAGVLRASEIRQFTEMGVPIVEELAAKLSKMNGELVTAAQVMDMVSKRAISFEMVKEVFDDMTSAGGMFYNMQEKQGNTLFGLWAKLGDAASVMYDEIGNTDTVNSAMKGTIQLLTDLMKNWREVGRAMETAAVGFAAVWSVKKVKGWQNVIIDERIAANAKLTAAQKAYTAALQQEAAAQKAETTLTIHSTSAAKANAAARTAQATATRISAQASLNVAFAESRAAAATTLWSKAWSKLKAAFVANWWMAAIAAIGALVTAIINANEKANRLKNTLKDIAEESGVEQMKSVRNFESLANVAVNAAEGSRKQKEALDELVRTYKDIIPQERLTIENLRAMKGNYDSLTESIKNYVAEQMKQKQVNAILEITGKEMIEKTREIQDIMKKTWSYEQIARFMNAYERKIRENPAILAAEAMKQAAEETGIGWQNMLKLGAITRDKLAASLRGFSSALKEQITQVDALDSAWNNNYAALGRYGNEYENLANKIKENPISVGGSPDIDEGKTPYLFKQQQQNLEILQAMIPTLKKIMSDAGVVWQDGWANIVGTIDKAQPQIISTIDFNAINKYLKDNLGLLTDEQRKAIGKLQDIYYNIGIPGEVVRYNRKIAIDLADSMSDALSKMGDGSRTALDNVTKYFMQSGTSVNDYAKTLDDALKDLKARIAEIEAIGLLMSPETRKELEDLKTKAEYVEKLREALAPALTAEGGERSGERGPRSTRRQELLDEIRLVEKLYKEYRDTAKIEGATRAEADMRKLYADSLQELSDKYGIELPRSVATYQGAIDTLIGKLQELRKAARTEGERRNLDIAIREATYKRDKAGMDELQARIEGELKELSDKISRTKTAREFYDRILSQTGDVELAATLTMNVYGEGGEDLFNNTVKLLQEYFSGVEVDLPINFDTQQIDYKALRKIWEADKALPKEMRKIPEAYDSAIKQMLDSADSANQKMIEGWLKATEKAKTYSDKLAEVYRTTATEIERIQKAMAAGDIDKGVGTDLIAGYQRKQAEEIAKLQYEAFKDSPMYVQMFDDLGSASTTMLNAMRDRLVTLKDEWKNLDPTQLKEMQQRLREIDEQLTSRNPFKALVKSLKEYRRLRTKGDALGSKSSKEADEKLLAATKKRIEAEEEYLKLLKDEKATQEQIADAKKKFDQAESDEKAAQKAKEVWQDVSITMGTATDTILGGLGAIGDIANGVADIMEAVGADEEDVTYWRTIGNSMSEITAGLQDVVQSVMKGDLMGVITGIITAIPKMFVGFVNIFNAGRIRKANKEIKRQQEILESLQYTYERLQAAADKLFGVDYISNYNQQMKNLEAQQAAYLKQAEAERSKGKKADEAKIKEYENAARDTANEIKRMQEELTAHFTGTSREDAAREFAKSWLEAKASFASTTDAIKSKYKDMLQSMVVEGAAAKVIDNALAPLWKKMEAAYEAKDPEKAIAEFADGYAQFVADANNGMETLWKALESRGIDLKNLLKDTDTNYTGIKRDIAGASEETMSSVATIGNTLMYYVGTMPGIAANVAAIRQMIEGRIGGSVESGAGNGAEWADWRKQAMDSYLAIERNTAENVVEARRAAQAAEAAVAELRRVIKPQRTPATHSLHVTIDG